MHNKNIYIKSLLYIMYWIAGIVVIQLLNYTPETIAGEKSVIIFKSQNIEAYNQVVAGFKKGSKKGDIVIREIYDLRGYPDEGRNLVTGIAKTEPKPDLIFTTGILAASLVKKYFADVPIIFSMVINYEMFDLSAPNISGIAAEPSIEKQFNTLTEILGNGLKVGVLYNPDKMQHIVSYASAYSGKTNHTIIMEELYSANEIARAVRNLVNKRIDALWLLPDSTIITHESLGILFKTAQDNNIPVFCTSDSLVRYGALFSVSADYYNTGLQAAEMAYKLLKNTPSASHGVVRPDYVNITINKKLAEIYGLNIHQLQLRKDVRWYSKN